MSNERPLIPVWFAGDHDSAPTRTYLHEGGVTIAITWYQEWLGLSILGFVAPIHARDMTFDVLSAWPRWCAFDDVYHRVYIRPLNLNAVRWGRWPLWVRYHRALFAPGEP